MLTRSTHRTPQTIKQAKAEYRKYGPRISSQERRQLERGSELLRRAEKIKDAEKRRKAAVKKRQDREQKEREERRRSGPAARTCAIRASQSVLEGFLLGIKKPVQGQAVAGLQEEKPALGKSQEPWEDEIDDGTLFDGLVSPKSLPDSPVREAKGCPSRKGRASDDSPPLVTPTAPDLEGAWDDLLMSNTQVDRELKAEDPTRQETVLDPLLSFISTQDVTLSLDDLQELGLRISPSQTSSRISRERDKALMPPPAIPYKTPKATNTTPRVPQLTFSDFELSTQDFEEMLN